MWRTVTETRGQTGMRHLCGAFGRDRGGATSRFARPAGTLGAMVLLAACNPSPQPSEVNESGIPIDLTGNVVLPVLLGLVVSTLLLIIAAYVAWRLGRAKDALPKPGDRASWWACAACGTLNSADREACFACHASRQREPTGSPPGTGPEPPGP